MSQPPHTLLALLAADPAEPVSPWVPGLLALGGIVLAIWWLRRGHGEGWEQGADRVARERADRELAARSARESRPEGDDDAVEGDDPTADAADGASRG